MTGAAYARLTRGAMLDALGEDYIRTARAKGIPEWRVVLLHALRSSLRERAAPERAAIPIPASTA